MASTSPKATPNHRKRARDEGRSVEHATFVVERTYDASPDRVFAAWSDPEAKTRWFDGSEGELEFEFDFRVAGRERRRGTLPDGRAYTFHALYQDIVRARRIVFTEQGAFLDGHEVPGRREQGMGSLLDALAAELRSNRAGA